MSRKRWPLTALALIAMVVLISACGSSAPADRHRRQRRQQRRRQCSEGGEVRRVHAQQRGQQVPGPGRVGQVHHRWDSERLVAGHEHPGVHAGASARARTWSQRGSRAASGAPAAGRRPQVRPVHPRQRRAGLPGPRQRSAPRRHESNPIGRTSSGMSILNAAMQKCRDLAAAAGVRSERKTGCWPQRPSWLP